MYTDIYTFFFSLRFDEEQTARAHLAKELRETENARTELQEDLDAEKAQRIKAEKLKRDLSEELEALKSELEDSLDTTAAQQDLRCSRLCQCVLENRHANTSVLSFRAKRENEVEAVKKALRDEHEVHEQQVQDMRKKQSQIVEEMQDEIESYKKVKLGSLRQK